MQPVGRDHVIQYGKDRGMAARNSGGRVEDHVSPLVDR